MRSSPILLFRESPALPCMRWMDPIHVCEAASAGNWYVFSFATVFQRLRFALPMRSARADFMASSTFASLPVIRCPPIAQRARGVSGTSTASDVWNEGIRGWFLNLALTNKCAPRAWPAGVNRLNVAVTMDRAAINFATSTSLTNARVSASPANLSSRIHPSQSTKSWVSAPPNRVHRSAPEPALCH